MHVCVCVSTYVHGIVYTCVVGTHVWVHIQKVEKDSGVVLYPSFPHSLRRGFLTEPKIHYLFRLACQQASEICLSLSTQGLYTNTAMPGFLHGSCRFEQFLMIAGQTLLPTEPSPYPWYKNF